MNEQRTLMAVHAHPDDEVFSTGGVLARYAAEGDRVVVVYCTNGEAGEMHDPQRDAEYALPRLGEIRQEEAREACALLGVTDVFFLGYRDSGMKDTDDNKNPAAFMNAPLEEATARLLDIFRETRPDVLITYDEEGGYGHPDHVMNHHISLAAFEQSRNEPWAPRKLYYSARSREAFRQYAEGLKEFDLKIPWLEGDFNFDEYGTPESEITAHIDISSVAPLKKQALAVHRTQIPADFFYLSIPDEALTGVAGVEFFVRLEPPPQLGEREDDLFAGLPERTEAVTA